MIGKMVEASASNSDPAVLFCKKAPRNPKKTFSGNSNSFLPSTAEIKMRRIVVLPAQAVRGYGKRENGERKTDIIKRNPTGFPTNKKGNCSQSHLIHHLRWSPFPQGGRQGDGSNSLCSYFRFSVCTFLAGLLFIAVRVIL
ncbi:MAG: hypothetical protein KBS76_08070, partial [Ruminococcus sp.]|nr:hypothetical protein [Candidatus Apopatosoma intestinale]